MAPKIDDRAFWPAVAFIGVLGAIETYREDKLSYLRCAGSPCPASLPHYAARLQAMHDRALNDALWSFAILLGMAVGLRLLYWVMTGVREAERAEEAQ